MTGRLVEAIEEGKIVRVPEEYAIKEELPVLRRIDPELQQNDSGRKTSKVEGDSVYGVDEFRKSLDWKKNQIVKDLVSNFHWEISKERRRKNLTRKQFAELINEQENTVKMIENGVLPNNDFVIINKIQSSLGINLRKDGFDPEQSARAAINFVSEEKEEEKEEKIDADIFSDDIEIVDEE